MKGKKNPPKITKEELRLHMGLPGRNRRERKIAEAMERQKKKEKENGK